MRSGGIRPASGWLPAATEGWPSTSRGTSRQPGSGADLLGGIQGSVRGIGVYGTGKPLRPLGSIENPQQVEHLVRLVLRAPAAEQDPASGPHDDEHYVVSFHLKDGTATSRLFNARTGFLAGGVVVPDEFIAAVSEAIGRHREATAP
jgi:hypothetical protein